MDLAKHGGVHTGRKKVAIVGLPNTGKSLLFNHLTGDYSLVSNYGGTTMEPKRAKCQMHGCRCEVIDTPGLHGLSTCSVEGLSIRDLIFAEQPDVIVQCIDANQLKQSLALMMDLLELGVPMAVALNAIDETARRGIWIDSTELSRALGVPVVETIATQGRGIADLKKAIAAPRTPSLALRYADLIEEAISDLQGLFPESTPYSRKLAVLLAMRDPFVEQYAASIVHEQDIARLKTRVDDLYLQFKGNVATAIATTRSRWVDEIAASVVRRQKVRSGEFAKTFGHLCRHPVFGIPILLLVLAGTYFLVAHAADVLEDVLNQYLAHPIVKWVYGTIPAGFWRDLIAGPDYGLLTLGLFNALCTVLPILFIFFLILGALEDMGYIPSLYVLAKRVFDKIGLNGNAAMSVVLGFGCKTMATLTTVGLPRKEKIIAVYLIAAYVPCSAQMALSMGVLGRYTFIALLATYGTICLMAVLAGLILNRILPDAATSVLIQEIPAIRWPNPRAVVIKTCYRLYWFLKEAVPIFVGAALALFLCQRTGLLDALKAALQPLIVDWLGMPLDMVDALILCVARHEAAAGLLIKMSDAGKLDVTQCISAVLLTTMFVPCLANVVAICKRVGWKIGLLMMVAMSSSAFAVVGLSHWILVFFLG